MRMISAIPVGIEDLGLHSLRSEAEYAPISFHDSSRTPWLPVAATIDVETARQHWRNTHRFSDYKHFSVSTQENVNEGSIKR